MEQIQFITQPMINMWNMWKNGLRYGTDTIHYATDDKYVEYVEKWSDIWNRYNSLRNR
jgi:hypothetical protein